MLHKNTDLIIKKNILIISGANGSGKTQILEALMLLLGGKSPRSKKGISFLIKDQDLETSIEIEVNNIYPDGTFVFQQTEPNLQFFLSLAVISFRAKVFSHKIKRYIVDPTSGKYKEISLRTIQNLFSKLGIRPNNQLTFTLGETVDIFSNQSNYKKFNVLIENLGLAELKQEILENEKGIKEALETTSRLQRKLKEEEENLDLFRTMIDTIHKREKLESQIESLIIERKWIDVFNMEKVLTAKNKECLDIFNSFSELKESVELKLEKKQKLNDERIVHKRALDEVKAQIKTIYAERREKQKILNTQEGTISVLRDQIIEYETELKLLEENEQDLPKRRKTLEQSLAKAEARQKKLKNEYKLKADEITSVDEYALDKKSKLYNYEIKLRDDAIKLKDELIKQNLDKIVLGPILSYIRLSDADENQQWLPAIKSAIGNYLYSFIALDSTSFNKCKHIYDSIFTDKKPSFDVFRFSATESKKRNIQSPLYAFVPDLLAGDPRVILMLKKIMTTALSDENEPNLLLDAAIKHQLDVLTKTRKSFYRRKGSFSRPPRPFNGDLGVEVKKSVDFKSIRRTKELLEKELFSIKKEETDLIKEAAEIRSKLKVLEFPDKEKQALKIKLKRSNLRIEDAKQEIQEISAILMENNDKIDKIKQEEGALNEVANELKETLIKLNLVIKNEQEKLELQNKKYIEAKQEIKETQDNLTTITKEISKIGPRPNEIRDIHYVDLKIKEIQTKLALVKDKSVPREKLEFQEKKVVELRENLIERRDHLEHLREDIQNRIDIWKSQIEPFIIHLSETLQDLTKNIFAQVRLEIDNPDLDKAGLELKAVTKGDFRHDHALSGGEKVLLMECLILALHALTTSPLHVIDEFTQRLDTKNKSKIFYIVKKLLAKSKEATQFILITPDTLGIDIEDNIQHVVISQAQLVE